MAAQRERAEWEEALLQSGMDGSDVDKRREQRDRLNDAAEALREAVDRQRTFAALLLEGLGIEDAERLSGEDDKGHEHLGVFRAEVENVAALIGRQDPSARAEARAILEVERGLGPKPPPPPRKLRRAKAKRKGKR